MTKTATHNVLLAPEQYETIAQMASQEGHSISDIAQEEMGVDFVRYC